MSLANGCKFLDELIPGKRIIAVLMNPDTPFSELALRELKAAAAAAHQPIEVFKARTAEQVPAEIEAAANVGAAGLITLEDPLLLSASQRCPSICDILIDRLVTPDTPRLLLC
jgi:putative ABC transport system substrate-binding protein